MNTTTRYRAAIFDHRSADQQARTVTATLSSESPVERYGEVEVLSHEPGAVDLARAADGLPLLFCHDLTQPIGVVEQVKLVGRKLQGVLRFGSSSRASEIFADVASGILRNVSIAYTIDAQEAIPGGYRATRWSVYEASVVSVPADPTVGIGRSFPERGTTMSDENTPATGPNLTVIQNQRAWQQREQERRTEIRAIFAPLMQGGRWDSLQPLLDTCLDDPGVSAEHARKAVLEEMGRGSEPLMRDFSGSQGAPFNTRGGDVLGEFIPAAIDGVLLRSGVPVKDAHPGSRDTRNMRLSDMAEIILRQYGHRTSGLSRDEIIRKALSTRSLIGHSSSDFPNLLENISQKALLIGFNEAPQTHRAFTRKGFLPDFKQASRVALGDFSDLDLIYANGEYKQGTFGDYGVNVQLATYGKMFSISRQALVNDDTAAFTQIPRGMAAAAVRNEADLAYAVLTGNPTMPDGTVLFHANHDNLVSSGSGAAPSVTTLNAARAAMGSQTAPGGSFLNISPAFMIVPLALESTGRILSAAEYDPDGTALMQPNPFRNSFKVIADPRLDASSTTRWYLAADPNQYDTIEVAYLDGQEAPFLESKEGWTVDGVEFKVRHDVAVAALDHRGLYRNDGV